MINNLLLAVYAFVRRIEFSGGKKLKSCVDSKDFIRFLHSSVSGFYLVYVMLLFLIFNVIRLVCCLAPVFSPRSFGCLTLNSIARHLFLFSFRPPCIFLSLLCLFVSITPTDLVLHCWDNKQCIYHLCARLISSSPVGWVCRIRRLHLC